MTELRTKNLAFRVNDTGAAAEFAMQDNALKNGDFWRLILDDGLRTEIPVFSRRQRGTVRRQGQGLVIEYDGLLSEYGDRYDIRLQIVVEKQGELLSFSPTVENHADVRVNECFCPLVCFDGIAG